MGREIASSSESTASGAVESLHEAAESQETAAPVKSQEAVPPAESQEPLGPAQRWEATMPALERHQPGTPLTRKEQEALWLALSDLFVDSIVYWRAVVRDCLPYDIALVREIFFTEVAPVCGPNLMAPIPPVWSGFNAESLFASIDELKAGPRKNVWFRFWYCLTLSFFRWQTRKIWKSLEWRLRLLSTASSPEELKTLLSGPEFDDE